MGEVVGWSLVPWSPEQTASVLAHAITTSGAVVTASSSQAVYGSLTTTTSSLGPQVEAGPGVDAFTAVAHGHLRSDAVRAPHRRRRTRKTDETVPLLGEQVTLSRSPRSRQSTRQFTIADAIDYIGKRFR